MIKNFNRAAFFKFFGVGVSLFIALYLGLQSFNQTYLTSRQLYAFVSFIAFFCSFMSIMSQKLSITAEKFLWVVFIISACIGLNRIPEYNRIINYEILQDDKCFINDFSYQCSNNYKKSPNKKTYYLTQINKMSSQVAAKENNYQQWSDFVKTYCRMLPDNGYEFDVLYEECVYTFYKKKLVS